MEPANGNNRTYLGDTLVMYLGKKIDRPINSGLFTELLPTDEEVEKWYTENITRTDGKECSASSAIYKFRLWLNEREKEILNDPLKYI